MLRILEREALRLIRKGFDKFIQFVDVERVRAEALEQENRRRIERRQKAVLAIQLLNVKLVRKFYVAWLDNHKQSRIHRKLQLYTVKVRLNQRIAIVVVKWREFVHAMKWLKRYVGVLILTLSKHTQVDGPYGKASKSHINGDISACLVSHMPTGQRYHPKRN